MVYYISETKKANVNAGGKAPADIAKICFEMGLKPLYFPSKVLRDNSFFKRLLTFCKALISWIRVFGVVKKGDILIYQHPMCIMPLAIKVLPVLKKRNIKVISLIHDLAFERFQNSGMPQKELLRYKKYDDILEYSSRIICHNKIMKSYLENKGYESKIIVSLEIFDYLCNNNDRPFTPGINKSVVIAGNFDKSKSMYIYKLQNLKKDFFIYLYGANYEPVTEDIAILYEGSYEADVLPEKLKGGFGLVWDGSDIEEVCGNFGKYLRINSSHKLSLYIAANIPVIIWKEAAMANFVLQHNIGFTINSLEEIKGIFSSINDSDYYELCKNTAALGERVRTGYYTKTAINKCINELQ